MGEILIIIFIIQFMNNFCVEYGNTFFTTFLMEDTELSWCYGILMKMM